MSKKYYIIRWTLVVVGFLTVCFSYYAYQIFFTDNFQIDKQDTYIYIRTGATFEEVKDTLVKREIVHDLLSFAFVSKMMDYQEAVKPGRYKIEKNANNIDVIRMLRAGIQVPIKFTFNNIRLKEDLIEKASDRFEFEAPELEKLLNDPKVIAEYGFNNETMMAMFIPNTYEMYWNTSAKSFLDRMHKEYERFWTKERKDKAAAAGLTPIQVTILASIIEAETNRNSEKQRMAGVYINRLNSGMKLQADPTLKFALKDFSIKRILNEHCEVESPYNTYKYEGLPPGPINLPSVVTIDAVLNYEKNKYLFFVASPDGTGHVFTEKYRDHVNSANRYREHLTKKGYR